MKPKTDSGIVSPLFAQPIQSLEADLLALAKGHYEMDHSKHDVYVAAVYACIYHRFPSSSRIAEEFRDLFKNRTDIHRATALALIHTLNGYSLDKDHISAEVETVLMELSNADTGRGVLDKSNLEIAFVIGQMLLSRIARSEPADPNLQELATDPNLQSNLTFMFKALSGISFRHSAGDILNLRRLLAIRSNHPLYTDDGELTTCDGSHIDFKHDCPKIIADKFVRWNTRPE